MAYKIWRVSGQGIFSSGGMSKETSVMSYVYNWINTDTLVYGSIELPATKVTAEEILAHIEGQAKIQEASFNVQVIDKI